MPSRLFSKNEEEGAAATPSRSRLGPQQTGRSFVRGPPPQSTAVRMRSSMSSRVTHERISGHCHAAANARHGAAGPAQSARRMELGHRPSWRYPVVTSVGRTHGQYSLVTDELGRIIATSRNTIWSSNASQYRCLDEPVSSDTYKEAQ